MHERFRKRILRRLTTPQELLYAWTRHWVLVAVPCVLGAAFFLAKVATDRSYYDGKATLLITTGDPLIADLDGRSGGMRREDLQTWVASRVKMLQSDSVLRRVVQGMNKSLLLDEDRDRRSEFEGPAQIAYVARRKVEEWWESLRHPNVFDRGEEAELRRAVALFRARSAVIPDAKTGTVQLRVALADRRGTEAALRYWIDEFRAYMQRASDQFLADGLAKYGREERSARKALEEARAKAIQELSAPAFQQAARPAATEAPAAEGAGVAAAEASGPVPLILDVSQDSLELLARKAAEVETSLTQLRVQRDGGPSFLPGAGGSQDPAREGVLKRLHELEIERLRAVANMGAQSTAVARIDREIEQCRTQLLGLGPAASVTSEDLKAQIDAQIRKEEARLAAIYDRYLRLKEHLAAIRDLEGELQSAREWRKAFERLQTLQEARANPAGLVQVIDEPYVSWEAGVAFPHLDVLKGAGIGLALGLLFAIVREILNGKVRFRNDIVGEYGLPVVGVIPRK